jgi:hypothetical protein
MQPLLIPIIDPEGFLEAINMNIKKYYLKDDIYKNIDDLMFNDEIKVNDIFKITTDPILKIKMGISSDKKIIKIFNALPGSPTERYEYNTPIQHYNLATRSRIEEKPINYNFLIANWGIFYMNVIINNNHFDILEYLIEFIINKRFNKYIQLYCGENNNKYIDLLKICKKNYYENKSKKNELSSDFNENKKIVLYDYFLTPYEGLYINENIVGIIKYCENINSSGRLSTVKIQDPNLDFKLQKTICRGLLLNPKGDTTNVVKLNLTKEKSYYKCNDNLFKIKSLTPGDQIKYYIYPILTNNNYEYKFDFNINSEIGMTNINKMYNNLSNYYNSSSIYNDGEFHNGKKKEILISKILTPYIGIKDPRIKDFKIFYLFSNESLDIKCFAQANLLELTDNFIKAIIPE